MDLVLEGAMEEDPNLGSFGHRYPVTELLEAEPAAREKKEDQVELGLQMMPVPGVDCKPSFGLTLRACDKCQGHLGSVPCTMGAGSVIALLMQVLGSLNTGIQAVAEKVQETSKLSFSQSSCNPHLCMVSRA